MKVPCKNIPVYDFEKKEWSTKSFENQMKFGEFLEENVWKEPGNYQFHKELTKKLWNEKALIFKEKGRYTEYAEGTEEYYKFWDEEELKCRLGVLWLYEGRWYYTTRDYYFLLNYFVIINKEVGYIETFMDPRDGQYHMMLYEKIAECFDLNSVILKRRQFAFSNCHVAKSINYMWFEYTKRIKWFAFDGKYLDNVNGSWYMLDIAKKHLNLHTGWYRDFSPDKPGSIQQRRQIQESKGSGWYWEGNESSIVSNTMAKDPAAGVGGPTWMAWYEEGGLSPTANLTLQFMEPAIQANGRRVGTFIIGGSVGDLDQCKPLSDFTHKPEDYGFYGVDTKWYDKSGVSRKCGLFIPAQYCMPEATDEHGNSLVELAMEILEKSEKIGWKKGEAKGNMIVGGNESAWVNLPEEDFILRKSQNPKTIEEAFAYRKTSAFNPQKCEKRQKQIDILKEEKNFFVKQGLMFKDKNEKPYLKELKDFPENERPVEMGYPVDPKIVDKRGVVNIYELPKEGCDYYAGVDSIEADLTVTSQSLFSIHIYRRSYTEFDKTTGKTKVVRGKVVACWTGRFDELEDTNEHASLLLRYYKAKAACERNKPNFINYCRRNGITQLIALTKDLPFDKDIDITGRENGQYGIWRDSAGKVISELIRVTKDYLNSELDVIYLDAKEGEDIGVVKKILRGYDMIDDYWTLEELKKFNTDTGNFDRFDSLAYAIHYGTAEELSFQNRTITVSSEQQTETLKNKKKDLIKKYSTSVKKYGRNRSFLNY